MALASRCARLAGGLAGGFLALAPSGGRAASDGYESLRKVAIDALEAGDCPQVWAVLWPAARDGEAQAMADLGVLGFSEGLAAPGTATDALLMLHNRLHLVIHGLNSEDPAARDVAVAMARSLSGVSEGAKALETCLSGPSSGADCAAGAIKDGLVSPFAVFSGQIEAQAAAAEAAPAQCGIWSDR